ncbi:hypothetical protein L292_3168 [Acinetobacter junii CIP 107470 = MTCC 11364]|uniref:Uncharacterized protein n=1 Tax=Acinetobacter junii CIP 107470 = MTCC 11364 TaxID=1217666 RepID=S7YCV5_ACIJU|nr:DUF6750 family protein [Acinetobacter junii]ENV52035.1 hypothetical protein F953_00525 [Acinetobacter junii CIP 107470 = MTCC 11364]EPR85838.1 hypothetical protein L292_3168 [Acinetobacter junii CIP 107470 = MTCC 11364]
MTKLSNLYQAFVLSLLTIFTKGHAWALSVQQRVQNNPIERRLMKASAAGTFVGLTLLTSTAHADVGIAGMIDTAAQQGDSAKSSFGKLFAAVGFILAGWGGLNWWKKSKEGENSRITGTQIWGPIVAGAVLGATGFVLIKAGETIGISSSQQGALPS